MRTIELRATWDQDTITATVYDRVVLLAFDDENETTVCITKDALRKLIAEMDSGGET